MPDQNYNTGDGLTAVEQPVGAWVAYHSDSNGLSAVTLFGSEVEALRHAVGNSLAVLFLPYGVDLQDADVDRWEALREKSHA